MTRVMALALAPLSLLLMVLPANAQSNRKIVSGRVVKNDGRKLTVSNGTTSVDVTDDDKTLVKIGGEPGEFDEISEGDKVTILLDIERGTAITVTVAGTAPDKPKPAKGRTTPRKAPPSSPAPRAGKTRYYPTGVSEEAERNEERLRLTDPTRDKIVTTSDEELGMIRHRSPEVWVDVEVQDTSKTAMSVEARIPGDKTQPPVLAIRLISLSPEGPKYEKDRTLRVDFEGSSPPLVLKEKGYVIAEVDGPQRSHNEGMEFVLSPQQFKSVFFGDAISFRLGKYSFRPTNREKEFFGAVYDEMMKTLGKQATESDAEATKPRKSEPKKGNEADTGADGQ